MNCEEHPSGYVRTKTFHWALGHGRIKSGKSGNKDFIVSRPGARSCLETLAMTKPIH